MMLKLLSILVVGSSLTASASVSTAEDVKEAFRHSWKGYVQYAWGHDALKPLSKAPHDWYNKSLLMTPVDALDTMLLMGLKEEAAQATELIVSQLKFDQNSPVSVFEITIRILGGLLSSYQMTGDTRLLVLAKDLGDRLLPAFESPTGMPYSRINFKTGQVSRPNSNPAEVGTLILEFGVLSKLTGNPVYYDKAKRALTELYRRSARGGLVGDSINVETGRWLDFDSHIGGGIDSYYEYLYKGWLLFGDPELLEMWESTIAAVNRDIAEEAPSGFWYGHADMRTGARTKSVYGALHAFFPALLAIAGDFDRAIRLQDSGYRMWTESGIEPEQFDYRRMRIVTPNYALRPEIIESAYYLWFLTGDSKYQRMGERIFSDILKRCKTSTGFAELADVRSGEMRDAMESFFFAETLKYAYLVLAPRKTLDLDSVVFNTEAHPLRKTW